MTFKDHYMHFMVNTALLSYYQIITIESLHSVASSEALDMAMLSHHFGPDRNILTTTALD